MEALSLQFPAWFILLCVGLGVVFALLLYYRDTTFRDQSSWVRWLMSVLRFLTVTTISLLLLSPFLKLTRESVQNPIIVVGQDNSASLTDGLSASDSTAYLRDLRGMISRLSEKFDVRVMTFGESTHPADTFSFNEKVTDIAQFLDQAADQYADQNLGAIVMATDGLFNRGRNPLYARRQSLAPVYPIALGDTSIKTDLWISHVLHNEIAFLGDQFPVQIDIAASKLNNRNAQLRLERIDGGQRILLSERPVRIDGDQFFGTEEILIEAAQPGIARYRVSLSGIAGESLYSNNTRDFYVEVIDGRVKVLILANSPHPDLAALKQILGEQQNYEATVELMRAYKGDARDYDLVVFHQLPSVRYGIAPILSELDATQIPRLFIVGSQTTLSAFNTSQPFLKIQAGQQSSNEVTAIVDQAFNLFTVPDNLTQQIGRFAPLQAPFGQYTVDPSARVYLWQQIGKVETQFPLLLFGETGDVKTGILAAEGFWRWRLYDFMQHGTHDLTHTLLAKTIQFLTVKEDKRRFRASPSDHLYMDNEVITFDAELYNRSYERVTEPDVFLDVRDDAGNAFHYTFSKADVAYTLSLGKYPVGEYQYTAYTDYDGTRQQVNGKFNVQQTELESYVTTADHQLLQALAQQTHGHVYYPGQLSTLADSLLLNSSIKPVMYQSVINQPLIHLRWIFFLFLFLLGLEWFIRRYLGGY